MRDYIPDLRVGVFKQETALIVKEQINTYSMTHQFSLYTKQTYTHTYTNRHVQDCSQQHNS